MDQGIVNILLGILILAGAFACVYIGIFFMQLTKTAKRADETLNEVNATVAELRPRIIPIIENLEQTTVQVNQEISMLDRILGDVSQVTDKLAETADKVAGLSEKPVAFANGVVDRFVRIRKERKALRDERREELIARREE